MIKSIFFIVIFCVGIVFFSFSALNKNAEHVKNRISLSLTHDNDTTQDKDTIKPKGLINKVIQPFKFNTNERIRVKKFLYKWNIKNTIAERDIKKIVTYDVQNEHARIKKMLQDRINKDSVNLAKVISKLKIDANAMKAELLAKIKLDSIKNKPHGDTAVNPITKPTNKEPVIADAGTSQMAQITDVKTRQQKINLVRRLFKAPIIVYNAKNPDSVRIEQLGVTHTAQVLGFYPNKSNSNITNFNFKLITTLVYSLNLIDGTPDESAINTSIINIAQKAGCNVTLSIYNNNKNEISKLLKSRDTSFIHKSITLLRRNNASGINFNFIGVDRNLRGYFVTFIRNLHNAYQKTPEHFKITISIPANDKSVGYDLVALDEFVQNFIIDYSVVPDAPGSLAPLNDGSNNSVETCFSFYLGTGIAASKFILGISYSGVAWINQPQKALPSIPYNKIRTNYSTAVVIYKKGESAAHIELDYKKTFIDIWYDNERTLGEKYEFALNHALGGIAIKNLGDDNGYGELQDELIDKFIKIDTCVTGIIVNKHTFISSLRDFIGLLFKSPCGQRINPTYSKNLGIINLCTIALLIVLVTVLFFQVKQKGDTWKYKRPLTSALIVLFALWSLVFLLWLFFWDKNVYFGPSEGKSSTGNCINIPFIILYAILISGCLVGVFIRWLYQINTNVEKP